jgi:hypothetical protein
MDGLVTSGTLVSKSPAPALLYWDTRIGTAPAPWTKLQATIITTNPPASNNLNLLWSSMIASIHSQNNFDLDSPVKQSNFLECIYH